MNVMNDDRFVILVASQVAGSQPQRRVLSVAAGVATLKKKSNKVINLFKQKSSPVKDGFCRQFVSCLNLYLLWLIFCRKYCARRAQNVTLEKNIFQTDTPSPFGKEFWKKLSKKRKLRNAAIHRRMPISVKKFKLIGGIQLAAHSPPFCHFSEVDHQSLFAASTAFLTSSFNLKILVQF